MCCDIRTTKTRPNTINVHQHCGSRVPGDSTLLQDPPPRKTGDVRLHSVVEMFKMEGGFAKVWLCSPVGHSTLPRLGGVLGMTAPTWSWSPGRPHFARAHVCSAPGTRAHGPNRARRKSRSPLCGRLRRSLRRLPFRVTAASTSCAVRRHQGCRRVRATCVIAGQPFHIVSSRSFDATIR
jgi:hypothetical protein